MATYKTCCHAERDPLHQGLIVERAKLKPRGYQLDLASRLGKTQVVTNSTPLNQQVPFQSESATSNCNLVYILQLARTCDLQDRNGHDSTLATNRWPVSHNHRHVLFLYNRRAWQRDL